MKYNIVGFLDSFVGKFIVLHKVTYLHSYKESERKNSKGFKTKFKNLHQDNPDTDNWDAYSKRSCIGGARTSNTFVSKETLKYKILEAVMYGNGDERGDNIEIGIDFKLEGLKEGSGYFNILLDHDFEIEEL